MGRSGFGQVWFYLFDVVAIFALVIGGVGSILAGMLSSGGEHVAWGLVFGGAGLLGIAFLAWSLAKIVFVLWLGLSPGQLGDNRYGPPPLR